MEVRTTVRNFVNEMTAHHIPFDARIRVIIDEPQIPREPMEYEISSVPPITFADQQQRLNRLPHDYDPLASDELIAVIEASLMNTDPIEL